jgi:hypothetical protein
MPLYQLTNEELMPLNQTSFQAENFQERRDIQRLLKDNIAAIDGDVLVIAEEFGDWSEGGRRIDLLAVDKDANLVVIELKRTDDGGHMELQAIRYAAMVANMTWEQAKYAYQNYMSKNGIEGEAEEELCKFLDWSVPIEDEFAQSVRIILASANFSKEITTSVLWLNERDIDIKCVRLSLYKLDDKLVLNAEQIIPLPEAESYQIEVRNKRREERSSRTTNKDHSLLTILYSGEVFEKDFKKANIGFFTIKLLEAKKLLNAEVIAFLKQDTSCGHRLIKTRIEVTPTELSNGKYRCNNNPELSFEGEDYYVARNWGITNIGRLVENMTSKFDSLCYLPEAVFHNSEAS